MEKAFGHQVIPEGRSREPESGAEKKKRDRGAKPSPEVAAEILKIWQKSQAEGLDLCDELQEDGYILSKGERRAFAVVDRCGEAFNPLRILDGVKTADLKRAVGKERYERLPTVAEAQEQQIKRRKKESPGKVERTPTRSCVKHSRRRIRLKAERRRKRRLSQVKKRRRSQGLLSKKRNKPAVHIKVAALQHKGMFR